MTLQNNIVFLKAVEKDLAAAKVLSPRVEAETLVTHFGRMTRLDLFTGEKTVSASVKRTIQKAVKIRKKGRPLSHLIGQASFYGYSFSVTKDTLIPRPETERLVEETLSILGRAPRGENPQILDIGTGSGCIAVSLTLQNPACRMTAIDASLKALKVARKNVELFGLSDKIQLLHSRLFDSFGKDKEAFWDVVVSNPPYIPRSDWRKLSREVRSEPRLALDGGKEGLETIGALLKEAPFFMKKGGWLLVEIGQGQSALLTKKLKQSMAFKKFEFKKDLNGIDRILVAQNG